MKSIDPALLELYRNCPHRAHRLEFATHVSITQHPRLILGILRGSNPHRQLHALRSSSKRTNSTLKDDNVILREPAVKSLRWAAVDSVMGVMTTLIDRVARFILGVTVKKWKFKTTRDEHWFDQFSPPEIPGHLKSFAQTA